MTNTFDQLKEEIRKALDERLVSKAIPGEATLILVDGFVLQPLSMDPKTIQLGGGPTLPCVAVVGGTTGQVYYFALKKLLPEVDI